VVSDKAAKTPTMKVSPKAARFSKGEEDTGIMRTPLKEGKEVAAVSDKKTAGLQQAHDGDI
jgi:hypothetical protein